MLVPTKNKELLQDIEYIFANAKSFGVFPKADGSLTLSQILESLLVFDRWCWITKDDLEDTLSRSEHFRNSGGHVRYLSRVFPKLPQSKTKQLPTELFSLATKEHISYVAQEATDNLTVRLYKSLRIALLVSASRQGSFENAVVMRVDVASAVKHGVSFIPLDYGIVLSPELRQAFISEVHKSEITALTNILVYEIKFYETLFLDDVMQQADAACYLFQAKPQKVVENELSAYLTSSDRYVRINVLSALGLPAYSVPFVPGRPLLPREERIEPVSLSPETVRCILALIENENDFGVIEQVVCTLKAQNYEGKLRELSPAIRQSLRKIVPKLEEEQTLKDSKQLLKQLPAN